MMTRRLAVAGCLCVASMLFLTALWASNRATPVTDVIAVAGPASTTPATEAAPSVPVSSAPGTPVPGTPVPGAVTPTTIPRSPLADALGGRLSALPEAPIAPVPPVALRLTKAGITDTPIRPVGLEADGQLEVPDETEIGWYRLASAPGKAGSTVLAAHVSWNRSLGPFARLGTVEPGDRIEVRLSDGSVRGYRAVERARYPKGALPADRIWSASGEERLVLITCGGGFNPQLRRYLDNIVVYATPDDA